MDVAYDFSDIGSYIQEAEEEIIDAMIDVGDEAVRYAVDHGTYKDHTLTLRTSTDYDVDADGLTLINDAKSPEGHYYASDVESRGYDVLSGAALYAERRLKEEFEV